MYADPRGPVALGAFRGDPGDRAGDRDFFRLVHQVQQHENLIAQLVAFVGRDKQAAVLDERHVRRIQHGLVLDRQGQNAVARPRIDGFIHADLHG
ncbi:hypothetical protein D3C87_1943760 [compost metagenome]